MDTDNGNSEIELRTDGINEGEDVSEEAPFVPPGFAVVEGSDAGRMGLMEVEETLAVVFRWGSTGDGLPTLSTLGEVVDFTVGVTRLPFTGALKPQDPAGEALGLAFVRMAVEGTKCDREYRMEHRISAIFFFVLNIIWFLCVGSRDELREGEKEKKKKKKLQ